MPTKERIQVRAKDQTHPGMFLLRPCPRQSRAASAAWARWAPWGRAGPADAPAALLAALCEAHPQFLAKPSFPTRNPGTSRRPSSSFLPVPFHTPAQAPSSSMVTQPFCALLLTPRFCLLYRRRSRIFHALLYQLYTEGRAGLKIWLL